MEQQRATEARAAATRRRDRALQPRERTKWDQIRMVIFLILFICVAGAIWSSAMGLFRHVKAR